MAGAFILYADYPATSLRYEIEIFRSIKSPLPKNINNRSFLLSKQIILWGVKNMNKGLLVALTAVLLPALAFCGNTAYGGYAKDTNKAYGGYGGYAKDTNKAFGGYARTDKGENKDLALGNFGFSVLGVLSMPSGDIAKVLNPTVGPEVSLTYRNFLMKNFHLQLSGDFLTYTGKVDTSNTFTNISATLTGRYDLKMKEIPGIIYLSAGGGTGFETLTVGGVVLDNIDPMYKLGFGYEASAFGNFTMRFDIKYVMLPQKYISGASRDGSFLNIYAGVNMEFGVDSEKRFSSEGSKFAMNK
jgi:hypothetical protein